MSKLDSMTVGELKEISALLGTPKSARTLAAPGRYILVVDRGWIFAGDLTETADGFYRLDNAVHVFRWESIGFAAMVKDWKSPKVDLRQCDSTEIPKNSVIFRIPVSADWGQK